MPGINRFDARNVSKSLGATQNFSENRSGRLCVFVSYKGDDIVIARGIVRALMAADVDVYFDENDHMLTVANLAQRHEDVVAFIERGIEESTHIMAVISDRTKESWWVSFEIGSARRKKANVAYIVKEGVKRLPSYLEIATKITSDRELHSWIRSNLPNYVTKSVDFSEAKVMIPNLPTYPPKDIVFYDAY